MEKEWLRNNKKASATRFEAHSQVLKTQHLHNLIMSPRRDLQILQ